MHPDIERELAAQRAEDLRRAGAAERVKGSGEVVLRSARRADQQAVASLAVLDETLPPVGPALVAEVDGSFVRDPALVRSAVAKEVGTTVLCVGGWPDRPFEPSHWELRRVS
jgi:hypothetical protein